MNNVDTSYFKTVLKTLKNALEKDGFVLLVSVTIVVFAIEMVKVFGTFYLFAGKNIAENKMLLDLYFVTIAAFAIAVVFLKGGAALTITNKTIFGRPASPAEFKKSIVGYAKIFTASIIIMSVFFAISFGVLYAIAYFTEPTGGFNKNLMDYEMGGIRAVFILAAILILLSYPSTYFMGKAVKTERYFLSVLEVLHPKKYFEVFFSGSYLIELMKMMIALFAAFLIILAPFAVIVILLGIFGGEQQATLTAVSVFLRPVIDAIFGILGSAISFSLFAALYSKVSVIENEKCN